jgi:hypothetical protein
MTTCELLLRIDHRRSRVVCDLNRIAYSGGVHCRDPPECRAHTPRVRPSLTSTGAACPWVSTEVFLVCAVACGLCEGLLQGPTLHLAPRMRLLPDDAPERTAEMRRLPIEECNGTCDMCVGRFAVTSSCVTGNFAALSRHD